MIENVILDLDNTLIHSVDKGEFCINKNVLKKMEKFTFHDMKPHFIVFERPGLQDFLTFLFKNYNVAVWSAGTPTYVDYIIDHVVQRNLKSRKLVFVYNSKDCERSKKKYESIKDLRYVYSKNKGWDQSNTVIIDDLIDVYNSNPKNTIQIKDFNFCGKGSTTDNHLDKILKMLKPKRTRS